MTEVDFVQVGEGSGVYPQVNRRVKLARSNVSVDDDGIEHYPLFAGCFIDSILTMPDGPRFVAYRDRCGQSNIPRL